MRKLTDEEIEILAEKYACELIRIGVLVWSGQIERADRLAEKILTKEGLLVRNSSNNDSNPKIYNDNY